MKLKTFELLDNSAVTRMFVSKTVTLDSQIVIRDKRVKVTDLDEDSLGRVWVNKGLYVISAASLAYTVPVEAEAEWASRVDRMTAGLGIGLPIPSDLGPAGNAVRAFGVYAKETAGQPLETVTEAMERFHMCPDCGKACESATGLASHVRAHTKAKFDGILAEETKARRA